MLPFRSAEFNRQELAGSLGDLGTFLPLLLGMAAVNGLDFATALFFAGLFNIITGFVFKIPLAVQPMKAIAAVALTQGLTAHEISAAGACVSFLILLLGLTNLMEWLERVIPKNVIRGLQLALGLSLLLKGLKMVAGTQLVIGMDSYLTAVASAFLVLLFYFRRFPSALILFGVGVLLVCLTQGQTILALKWGFSLPSWSPPAWQDFVTAASKAVLPQIPLTALNSVIAVCALSVDLFPNRPAKPRSVAVSVGCMNLLAAWFGGMPLCHGAGGLAGQYRFGARTNGSILFLGSVKMMVAILFGSSLMAFCKAFPASILGIMLAVSGVELALVTRDQVNQSDALVMLLTTGICLAFDNICLGFVSGLLVATLFRFVQQPPTDPST